MRRSRRIFDRIQVSGERRSQHSACERAAVQRLNVDTSFYQRETTTLNVIDSTGLDFNEDDSCSDAFCCRSWQLLHVPVWRWLVTPKTRRMRKFSRGIPIRFM